MHLVLVCLHHSGNVNEWFAFVSVREYPEVVAYFYENKELEVQRFWIGNNNKPVREVSQQEQVEFLMAKDLELDGGNRME